MYRRKRFDMAGRTDKSTRNPFKKGDIVYHKNDIGKRKFECCHDEFKDYVPIIKKGEKFKPNWDGSFDGDERIQLAYIGILEKENITKSEKRKNLLDDILIDSGFFKNFFKK